MHAAPFAVALVASSICIAAQSRTTTSPPGLESTEGRRQTTRFGAYSNARWQFVDEEFVGDGVKMITQVGYRPDWQFRSTSPRRSWPNVTLRMTHLTSGPVSTTFTANHAATPTLVFSAGVSWPETKPRTSGTGPFNWDATFAFPFSSPWKYAGTSGLIAEYLFTGGTIGGTGYDLDASDPTGFRSGGSDEIFNSVRSCTDPRRLSPARIHLDCYTYAQHAGQTSLDDTIVLYSHSTDTAPNASVIHAMGVGGYRYGVFIGLACNRLHLNTSLPTLLQTARTNVAGDSGTLIALRIPYHARLVGQVIYGQAAWSDSVSGQFLLSRASTTKVMAQPADPYRRFVLGRWDAVTPTAEIITNDVDYNPLPLYTYQ